MAQLRSAQLIRGADLVLLTVTSVFVLFGLAALYSFSITSTPSDYTIFIRQLLFAVVGFLLAAVFLRFDYRLLSGLHWILYGVSLAVLIAVRLFGATVRGTTGWFEFSGIQFQPVEFVKIILVIVLAKYFADNLSQLHRWRVFVTGGCLVAAPLALVLWQPDFGSAVILFCIWLGYAFVLPWPRRFLLVLSVGLVGLVIIGWSVILRPYQQERILTFLAPGRDPLGSGYNVRQAVTAVGAGQLFGRGLGLGTQSQLNFLPERHTDFIFASMAEELGFVGGAVIVLFEGLFFWRIGRLIVRTHDTFSRFLCLGLGVLFFIQVSINISMNLGLFPVTGIPLPFLSYGGSSLIASLLAVGILESVAIRHRTIMA